MCDSVIFIQGDIKMNNISLSGLSTSDINTKLSLLKAIICDTPDCVLLDYLLKADLNIDAAINLHFGNTPSPSPTHNNVCNESGNRTEEQSCAESSILAEANSNNQHVMCRKRKWGDLKNEAVGTHTVNKRRRIFDNDENDKENAINYQSIKHTNSSNTNNKAQFGTPDKKRRELKDAKSPTSVYKTPENQGGKWSLHYESGEDDKEMAIDCVNEIIKSSSTTSKKNHKHKVNGSSVMSS